MPWWAYGPSGMQLWFPSLLPTPSPPPAAERCAPGAEGGAPKAQHRIALEKQGSDALMSSPLIAGAAAAAAAAAAAGGSAANGDQTIDIELGGWRSREGALQRRARLPATRARAGRGSRAAPPPPTAASHACAPSVCLARHPAGGAAGAPPRGRPRAEVDPIGVSLADASIVGATQRLLRVPLGGAEPGQVLHGPGGPRCCHGRGGAGPGRRLAASRRITCSLQQ
jgi:hypothetical protein